MDKGEKPRGWDKVSFVGNAVGGLGNKMSKIKQYSITFVGILLLVLGWSHTACGKVYIDIDSPTFQKFPIAITDFSNLGGGEDQENLSVWFADALTKNLQITGFFRMINKNAFLEDANRPGITIDGLRFSDWVSIGAETLVKGGFQYDGKEISVEFRLFDVIQGKLIVGKKYWGKLEDKKVMVLKFASEIIFALTGERGVFDTKIAFVRKKGKISNIYVINFDGSELTRITNYRSIILSPHWSPDGKEISFTSYVSGNPDLYIMDMAGGNEKKISSFQGLNLSAPWSPAGRKILLTLSKDGNEEIYVLNLKNNKLKRLTFNHSIDVSPTWSPDGRKIAFVSNRSGSPQIYLMDADGNNARRLTYEGGYNTSPTWSPRGHWIAYEGMTNGCFQIFSIDEEGSNMMQLTFDEGNCESPSWSPDGRYLAFNSKKNGKSRICVINSNGANTRILHEGVDVNKCPSWSPRLNLY